MSSDIANPAATQVDHEVNGTTVNHYYEHGYNVAEQRHDLKIAGSGSSRGEKVEYSQEQLDRKFSSQPMH